MERWLSAESKLSMTPIAVSSSADTSVSAKPTGEPATVAISTSVGGLRDGTSTLVGATRDGDREEATERQETTTHRRGTFSEHWERVCVD